MIAIVAVPKSFCETPKKPSSDHRPRPPHHDSRPTCSNTAMNTSIAYPFVPSLGYDPINALTSMPGMPCHCRTGIHATQTLINAKLTSASQRLDDLDAALASSSLPNWAGIAAESYRARLDELRKQSLALRDALNDTSRILWSVGAV